MLIGNTILIGILRTPGDVAARLPSPALFIGVWVIGGLYALLGAVSLAEPGAMLARSGGQYPIVRRGLGEYPAFVVGWSDWISTCGPVALGGMVFTEYLEPLVPALAGRRVPAGVGPGAPLRPAALARHPDRRPLPADPERGQGAGVRQPDRGLPARPGAGRRPRAAARRRRSPRASRWSPPSCWRSRR